MRTAFAPGYPGARTGASEPGVGSDEAKGAQKDIAVEGEESAQTCAVNQFASTQMAGTSTAGKHQGDSEDTSSPFSYHCRRGDASDAPVPPQDQREGDCHVDDVNPGLQ